MKSVIRLFLLGIILNLSGCNSNSPVTIVKVDAGKVEGVVEDDITVFKGIPFAAPPVGNLRWKAPQPVKTWDGVLKADKYGPSCPQMQRNFAGMQKIETSEDCLYLNVWTPAKKSREKLPVMVWIYGGGFAMGSTSYPTYSGEQLAKMGVIVVSVAYRVGPLGFMAHPELTAESENHVSGNYGLLDQIAGLRWVQRNIKKFGGDPSRVTIFGESAGAISVSMLAASPQTKGLFSGAISESGGSFGPARVTRESDCMQLLGGAEKTGVEFMKRIGANSLAELRTIPPEKWENDPLSQMGGFWPVIDGYVIADDQYKLYESGKYNDVPVIIGTNSDEGSMFARPVQPEQYVESIKVRFGPVAEKILNLYPVDSLTGTYRPLADIFRETVFAWPSWVWARLQTQTGQSKVFVYYFDEFNPEPIFPNAPAPKGAAHGSEIAYVFRHLEQNPSTKVTEEQKALSEMMAKYWTNFAKNGDPNGEGIPTWPAFRDSEETVMYLKGRPHTAPVQNLEMLKAIDEYFSWKRNGGKSE
jgi:para-nitrobenzyl esterase